MFRHLLRAGGAVHAQGGDRVGFHRGDRGGHLGPQMQRSCGFDRDLRHDGEILLGLGERVQRTHGGGLRLQDILAGLDQEDVSAAVD